MFAGMIKESFQEKLTHEGRADFQAENRRRDIKSRESPIGEGTKSRHPWRCVKGFE